MGKKSRRRANRAQRTKEEEEEEEECTCPVCTGTGWVAGLAGRGGSEKCRKKDRSRITRAQKRNEPAFISHTTKPFEMGDLMSRLRGYSEEEAENVVRYAEYVTKRVDSWSQVHTEICAHEKKGEWQAIEDKATEQMQQMVAARLKFGVTVEDCVSLRLIMPTEKYCFSNRAQARMRGLNNLQGAVEDFTKALSYSRAQKGAQYGSMSSDEIQLLYDRSVCLQKLNQLDAAYDDLKACCSAVRSIGEEWNGDTSLRTYVVRDLLMVMAKQKVQAGATRPFFTEKERDKIEHDLGLNMYDPENYRCKGCGATPSPPKIVLKKCGGCMHAWFCSKECQLKARKSRAHSKSECKNGMPVEVCRDEDRAAIDEVFEEQGDITCAMTDKGQPQVLLMDVTGRYYDALTDRDVFFLPSEEIDMRMEVQDPKLMDLSCFNWEGPFVSQDEMMENPQVKEKFFRNFAAVTTPFTPLEVEWNTRIGFLSSAFGDKSYKLAETRANTIEKSIAGFLTDEQASEKKAREIVAKVYMIPVYEIRATARIELEKFHLAIQDATEGLKCIGYWQTLTQDIHGPRRQYGVREKARLLYTRSQSRKRLEDFKGAQDDLRACIQVIRTSGAHYGNKDAHPCFILGDCLVSLGQAVTSLQIAMTLQKVKARVPRLHYSEVECRSLEQELGLSHPTSPSVIVNSENMGDIDKWAFETFGVYVITVGGEERVAVCDSSGNCFESLSDIKVLMVRVHPEGTVSVVRMPSSTKNVDMKR